MNDKNGKSIHQKIFFTFFRSHVLPKGIVVITPIGKIFNEIEHTFPLVETTKGWWKRAVIKIGSSSITVLKIPPGNNYIKDCLFLLNPRELSGIIFLGYCASLSKKIDIGEIVIPYQALFGKRKFNLFQPKVRGLSKYKKYKIALVQQMLLPERKLKKIKAQLGDMETYFLYKFSKIKNIPILALLIVTDSPLFYPFYCISRADKIKLNSSIKKLMILLMRYVYKSQREK